jgi:hypothetical protein
VRADAFGRKVARVAGSGFLGIKDLLGVGARAGNLGRAELTVIRRTNAGGRLPPRRPGYAR